ncbi:uncharacterized protein [Leptinotarsa decemlineata]|uniref:uncharacterized protein n=1 Tax=Leptinotarsa decemlineata TaxID=7539 RepID=UPI003D30AF7F
MGYEKTNKNLKISKAGTESIEIYSVTDQKDSSGDTFSVDYLFNIILVKEPSSPDIDLRNISVLQLSHCGLTDLPKSCCNLNLRKLDLSHNRLSEVPICLYSGLKHLEILNLSHNVISSFHLEPECVASIRTLKLNNNCFNSLPKWVLMFRCTNLEELNYSTNKADNYSYLKNSYNLNIMRLKKLKLRNCHLIQADYAFLRCFKPLTYLDISNKHDKFINKLNEVDELFVRPKWRHLQILKMNNLSLAFFPEGIAWLENLTELHMKDNCISWLPDGIEFMVNLIVLDVSNNDMVAIPEKLTKLEGLEVLKASDNYITSVPDFTFMSALRVLDLYDNSIELISFNPETVMEIDLENNYLNTEDLQDCDYEAKRDRMRMERMFLFNRLIGPKLGCESLSPSRTYTSSLNSEDELDTRIDELDTNILCSKSVDDEEDWDLPRKEIERSPEIDSDDHEWTGSEDGHVRKPKAVTEKLYIADEDWMFVDVDTEEYL